MKTPPPSIALSSMNASNFWRHGANSRSSIWILFTLCFALTALMSATRAKAGNQADAGAGQTCSSYGFVRDTPSFSDCLMQLDLARQRAVLAQQQYQLQLQQYEQQVAAFEAREAAIKRERKKQAWAALGRFGAGMAASQSPTFGGAMADGDAAMRGLPPAYRPPAPPQAPAYQEFTIRTANGGFARCVYETALREVRCR